MSALLDEVKHIHDFITAQSSVLGGDAGIMNGQAHSLIDKVKKLQCVDHQLATSLTQLIGCGPWSKEHKESILTVIAAKVGSVTTQVKACSGRRRANQVLNCIQNYCTIADLDVLKGSSTDMIKLTTLVERCLSIGLDIPTERTVQHLVSFLWHHCRPGSSDVSQAYPLSLEFKRILKMRAKTYQFELDRLTAFPDSADDLPQAVLAVAYPDGQLPSKSSIDSASMVVASAAVPCRKSSKLVRSAPYQPPTQMALLPTSSNNRGMQPDQMQMYMQGMMNAIMFMQPSAQGQQLPGFRLIPPTPPTQTTPELPALTNGSTADELGVTDNADPSALAQPAKAAPVIAPSSSSNLSLFDLPSVPPKKAALAAQSVHLALATRPVKKKKTKKSKKDKGAESDDANDETDKVTKPVKGKDETDKVTTPVKGKPAAAMKSQNAPESKRSADDKWKGLPSEATRKKKRPNGCSKCRWKTVGCTPSCWRK